jgi:hypothetical protein
MSLVPSGKRIRTYGVAYRLQLAFRRTVLVGSIFMAITNHSTSVASRSTIYRLGTNKKALSDVDNAHLVEHLEKSLHLLMPEYIRWQDIIGSHYHSNVDELRYDSSEVKPRRSNTVSVTE